ncbi:MAG: leucyl aminopeptidase [Xanthomonadales bacterium]|jgi:leucyl aminopeptidase|nr:leucyl aminopeptidase [Xanthomonadales bacterium]
MQYIFQRVRAADCDAALAIVGIYEEKMLASACAEFDELSGGQIKALIESGDLSGKLGSTQLLHRLPGLKTPRLLVVGLGEERKFDAVRYLKVSRAAAKALVGTAAVDAVSYLPELLVSGKDLGWKLSQALMLSDYQLYRYTATLGKPPAPRRLTRLVFSAMGDGTAALARADALAAGVRWARELGNLPPNVCTPSYLAVQARELAQRHASLSVQILEREQMQALGMGALLAVASGSAQPPKLIAMHWNGGGDAAPYVLVGKGITFDTGGISIKPSAGMEEMKFDMCGAASVFGVMEAVARLGLPINLIGVTPAVENMPDGNACRPSDVVKTMSGQTVEILNTDAEGRLILCDALTWAQQFKPQALVDIATLTGACVVALGSHATGLMSRDDALAEELLKAGEETWDRAWRLPLWEEYGEQLETGFADVANLGGKYAGAITAGAFLARFTEGQRWAHLDIAGSAWEAGRKGTATGRPVALLVEWLSRRATA